MSRITAIRQSVPLLAMLLLCSTPSIRHGFAQANDKFANRATLTGTNVTASGTNAGASRQQGEPDHSGNLGGKSVWWMWTAPSDGEVRVTTDGSNFDTLLAIYAGSTISALTSVATNDDHGVQVTSRVRFDALAGTSYSIAVDGFNDGTNVESGAIALSLVFTPAPITRPANDSFSNRFVLSGARIDSNATNVEATREPGERLHAGKMGDTSIWWTWSPPQAGSYKISTEDSSFDTLLAVYRGNDLTNLVLAAANDDLDPTNGVNTSAVTILASADEVLQIAIDGYDGAWGDVVLSISWVDAPPELSATVASASAAVQLAVKGPVGADCVIEQTSNFGGWTNLTTLTLTNGVATYMDFTATNAAFRFYRAAVPGPKP